MTAVLTLFVQLLRRSRGGIIALSIGLFVFEFIQPVAIDAFGNLDQLVSILDLVPKPFLALMNVTPEVVEQVGLPGFLALGFTHPVYHLLVSAIIIWVAARALAGEMERGQVQIALARPISRRQFYLARVLAVVLVALWVSVVASLGNIAGIAYAQPDGSMDTWHFVAQVGASFLLALTIGGVALLVSARADRMGQAVGWAAGFLVVSYVIDYFATLWAFLEPIQPFSVFDYYDPPIALATGSIPWMNVLVLGTVALVCVVAGAVVFDRRDLPN
ncbi:MAG: ABC transporter permease [Thermomicrobiales bacterium]|nr:ABC transporter permease [Thermomicrobiales bacterium]